MARTILLLTLWLGLIAYAFVLAPPDRPDTLELITRLSTGQLTGINPLIVALFNIMGIWPLIYGCVLFSDGRGQKLPAWLFVIGSFGVGAFALLPYLALRQPNPTFVGPKTWAIKFWDARWLGLAIAIGAIGLLGYGLTQGDWPDFIQQWQTSRFIHVMSLDFCLLCGLFPLLLGDDMARRGLDDRWIFWVVSFLPLLGPIGYIVLRPSIGAAPASNAVSEV